MQLLATCAFGLEAVVARELAELGFDAQPVGTGRVLFEAPEGEEGWRAIASANLWLRAADRVLIRVGSFPVPGEGDQAFDALFEGVRALPWERFIHRHAAFPVAGRCVRSRLSSEPAVQRTAKRAIVERLRAAFALPEAEPLRELGPKVAVEVSILNDVATLTIDTSGAGLHKRGYRAGAVGEASLKETLAAGLVLLSVWRPGRPLVDPFCGAGTIAIEAALIGRCIAPGLRRSFDAEGWWSPDSAGLGYDVPRLVDPSVWKEARAEAEAAVLPDRLDPVIHASDVDEAALRLARANARDAGVEHDIQFSKRDALELSSRKEFGVVITNPPYGVRIGEERATETLYRALPGVFRRLPTWSFHIFTARLDLERLFAQEATRRRKLYNSTLECGLFSFLGPKPPAPGPRRADAPSQPTPPAATAAAVDEPAEAPADLDVVLRDAAEGRAADQSSESRPAEAAFNEPSPADETQPTIAPTPAHTPDAAAPPALPDRGANAEPPASPRPAGADRSGAREQAPSPPRWPGAKSAAPAFGGLGERERREAGDFSRCLASNLRHLRKYPSRGVTCYRVYERDVPDVPLIIDRYEDRYHVSEYERPHARTAAQQADWLDLMRAVVAETAGVPLEAVYMKEKHRQRGLTQHEKAGSAGETFLVQEGGLRFEVNLSDYVDTGLFLDHRLTRAMVRGLCSGKRVLNLFCYTGSFTVYAAAGGAAKTTSVDLSNTYLEWAARNLGVNRLTGPAHRLVRSDVMEFLASHARPAPGEGAYDLAVVDPPTFSNSKATEDDWEVAVDHAELLSRLSPLMAPGGQVFFSTNYRRFKLDEAAVASAGFSVREISRQTVPSEYRNRRIHRCWRLSMVGPEAARAALAARAAAAPREADDGQDSSNSAPDA